MANENVIRLQLKRGDKWDIVSSEHQLYDGEPAFSRNTTLTGHQYGREIPENYLYIGDTDSTTGYAAFANAADMLTITNKLSREIIKLKNKVEKKRDEIELLTDGCFYNKGIVSGGALSYTDGTIFLEDTTAYIQSEIITGSPHIDIGPAGRDLDLENDLYENFDFYSGAEDATDYKKYIILYKDGTNMSMEISSFYYPPEHTPSDFPQSIAPGRGLSSSTAVRMKNFNHPGFYLYDNSQMYGSLDYTVNPFLTNNEIYEFSGFYGNYVQVILISQMVIAGYITAGGEIHSYYGSGEDEIDFGPYGRTITTDPTTEPYYQRLELNVPYIQLTQFSNMKNKIIYQSYSDYSWVYADGIPETVTFNPATDFRARYQAGGYTYGNINLPMGNLVIECNSVADCVVYSVMQVNSYKDWPYNSTYIGV